MEPREMIKKYNLKIARRDGKVGFIVDNKYMKDTKIFNLLKENKEEIKAELLRIEKEQKEKQKKELEEKYQNDDMELTVEYSHTYGLLVGEFSETKRGEVIEGLDKKTLIAFRKIAQKNGHKLKAADWDTMSETYKITVGELEKYINQAKEEVELKKEKIKIEKDKETVAKFEEAKRTRKPVMLRMWSEDCNDINEECDVDNIIQYAMPDGTTRTERYHTW